MFDFPSEASPVAAVDAAVGEASEDENDGFLLELDLAGFAQAFCDVSVGVDAAGVDSLEEGGGDERSKVEEGETVVGGATVGAVMADAKDVFAGSTVRHAALLSPRIRSAPAEATRR